VRRAAALTLAVLMLAAQQGDGKPTARASICLNRECSRTAGQGFEPATIRVTYAVPRHADNRIAEFAVFCSSGAEYRSRWVVSYPDVAAGECLAVIAVQRSDGSVVEGKSQPVRVLAVLD
jgi:hypothetical protein